jgi:hypothetical protein
MLIYDLLYQYICNARKGLIIWLYYKIQMKFIAKL